MSTATSHSKIKINELIPDIFAGLLNGTLLIVIVISFATLIFSGSLESYLPQGIGTMAFSMVVLCFTISLLSAFRGVVTCVQDGPIAVMAVAASQVTLALKNEPTQDQFVTLLMVITLNTLLTGLVFILLGRYKLGNLIRFIPYPVIGGFLAGTGLLIFEGGMGILTGLSFSVFNPQGIWDSAILARWLPSVIYVMVMIVATRRYQHYLILPGMLIGAVALFWLIVALSGTSTQELQNGGWTLGPYPAQQHWKPIFLQDLGRVHWDAIVDHVLNLPTAVMIAVVALLLNGTGLEVAIRDELDLDKEMQVAGLANLLSALGGGFVGFHTLGPSMLGQIMGAKTRLVGLLVGAMCAVMFVAGPSFIMLFPNLVLGGMLVFLGLTMMIEWLYDGWFKMLRIDYAVIVLIVVMIALLGYLQGIAIGILASIGVFTVQFSRLAVIKHSLSGSLFPSKVHRPAPHQRFLSSSGDQIHLYILNSVIFFGTANALLNQVRTRIQDTEQSPLRYLIMDFHAVQSLDSSVVITFTKLKQLAESENFVLVFAAVNADCQRIFEHSNFALHENTAHYHYSPILDEALEWAEDSLLERERVTQVIVMPILQAQLEAIFPHIIPFKEFVSYLERREFGQGEYLARQGEPSNAIFFVESGEVEVRLELGAGKSARIRKVSGGSIIGELAYYSGSARSASIVAASKCVIFALTKENLEKMESEQPTTAAAFHKFIAYVLAERLTDTTASLLVALQ